jgi:hypothetical protein
VWSNYNVTFNEGQLEVLARQIYIKIIEGLNKTYGDADPVYTKTYVDNKYGVPNNYVVDGSLSAKDAVSQLEEVCNKALNGK